MKRHATWQWVLSLATLIVLTSPLAAQVAADSGSMGAAVVSARFLHNLEQAKAAAADRDLKILIDFYTDW